MPPDPRSKEVSRYEVRVEQNPAGAPEALLPGPVNDVNVLELIAGDIAEDLAILSVEELNAALLKLVDKVISHSARMSKPNRQMTDHP